MIDCGTLSIGTSLTSIKTSKHQNIVSVNYSCEDDENIYIAMPHYSQGSLESIIKKGKAPLGLRFEAGAERFLQGFIDTSRKNPFLYAYLLSWS